MNQAVGIANPAGGPPQRLGATLTLSVLVHVLLIAGIGFSVREPAALVPTLDVIFSQTSTPLTPKQADFLAQAAAPVPPPQARVVSSRNSQTPVAQARTTPPPERPRSDAALNAREQRDADMARLAAEVHLRSEQYAKRPSRKFVSASTREYAYANYLRAWVDRAERVGNLNYPDQARQQRLGGQVVITVGVRRDGSVESARVLRSSGTPLLDDAALRIVTLAQPFPALPDAGDGIDILQVTRTWSFLPGGSLRDVDR
jgi:protein TonB